jgi:hypothetical protein
MAAKTDLHGADFIRRRWVGGGSKRCERINFVGTTSEFQLSGNLKYPRGGGPF